MIPQHTPKFENYAGRADVDAALVAELEAAGIKVEWLPELCRNTAGEVKTIVIGTLHGWTFRRLWYYWAASGPGIPLGPAMELHTSMGKEVRVDGHCGCPSPLEWFEGLGTGSYHVDTPRGLKALATTLNMVVSDATASAKLMRLAELKLEAP